MSGLPAVTVIIPTRDCLQWLPAAIDSIGPRPDVEIIVVDDGSGDGTDAWLAAQAASDPRLRPMIGHSAGAAIARNIGIEAARAPLIAFLDADDTWLPGKLDVQLALHERHPEIGFSFTNYRHITASGADLGLCFAFWPRFHARHRDAMSPFKLGDDALAELYAENVVGTSTVIARRDLLEAVGGFATDMPTTEDWDLWLRLASSAPVGCVPAVFADYLMHRPGNLSGQRRARIMSMRVIAARYGDRVRQLDPSSVRACEARIMAARAELAAGEGRRVKGFALRLAALGLQPTKRGVVEAAAALLRR